ncbi:HMA domain-containing protein [Cephalotus follicularis]|uniref:HMA domain-containing protein n=1 Tax=Cephalotus follicularis TaxID=3775 RepID=A0A1Q3BKK6_CEPFO|nr:HMA domain-containing protein [Cephalotus follicularis]
MKQIVLIKVCMDCEKSRAKAMRVVVGFSGVESASLKGDDKSQIEVTGENIDPVVLTTSLRKKVGHADILLVAPKKEEKKEEKKDEPKIQSTDLPYPASVPHHQHYEVIYPYRCNDNPSCSIM